MIVHQYQTVRINVMTTFSYLQKPTSTELTSTAPNSHVRFHGNAMVINRKCEVSPTDGEEYPPLTSFAGLKRTKLIQFKTHIMVKYYLT